MTGWCACWTRRRARFGERAVHGAVDGGIGAGVSSGALEHHTLRSLAAVPAEARRLRLARRGRPAGGGRAPDARPGPVCTRRGGSRGLGAALRVPRRLAVGLVVAGLSAWGTFLKWVRRGKPRRSRPASVERGVTALPGRVLVDLPNWLGDFVHTLPAVLALQAANHRGETWAAAPGSSRAARQAARRDRLIVRPRLAGWRWSRRHLAGRFDVVLTARHSTRAKLLVAATGAPLRLASLGQGTLALGLDGFPVDRTRHQRHDLDAALMRLGVPAPASAAPLALPLPLALTQRGQRQRRLLAGPDSPVVALLPGAHEGWRQAVSGRGFPIVSPRSWRARLHPAGGGRARRGGAAGLWSRPPPASAVVPTAWGARRDRRHCSTPATPRSVTTRGSTHLAAVIGTLDRGAVRSDRPGADRRRWAPPECSGARRGRACWLGHAHAGWRGPRRAGGHRAPRRGLRVSARRRYDRRWWWAASSTGRARDS